MKDIRKLHADEIDARIAQIIETKNWTGVSLLLYKDARVDQRILDETFGPLNWQRSHQEIDGNLYCTVSVWDEAKEVWVSKQDVGTESYTEAEKGQASDSFKRACFNWGIGRELYTAPDVLVDKAKIESTGASFYKDSKGKTRIKGFVPKVAAIGYDDKGNINSLSLSNKGKVVYTWGSK